MKTFNDLRAINVNDHTEKKGKLTYLSWAWAVDVLLQNDPKASWSYGIPATYAGTVMVFCTVNAFGKSMTAHLPVMDYKNQAIENPNSMAVNTAMQRCLAKAIALHGIGLYIYAGEDLPEAQPINVQELAELIEKITQSDSMAVLKINYEAAIVFCNNDTASLKAVRAATQIIKEELMINAIEASAEGLPYEKS
jgi:hypothetical protein